MFDISPILNQPFGIIASVKNAIPEEVSSLKKKVDELKKIFVDLENEKDKIQDMDKLKIHQKKVEEAYKRYNIESDKLDILLDKWEKEKFKK